MLRWASGLHEEDEALRKLVADNNIKLAENAAALDDQKRRVALLTEQLERARNLASLAQEETSAVTALLSAATQRHQQMSSFVGGYEARVETERAHALALSGQLGERDSQLAALNQQLAELTAKIVAERAQNATMLERHEASFAVLRSDFAALGQTVSVAAEKQASTIAETLLLTEREQVRALSGQLRERESQLADTHRRIDDLNATIKGEREQNAAAIARHETSVGSLRSDLAELGKMMVEATERQASAIIESHVKLERTQRLGLTDFATTALARHEKAVEDLKFDLSDLAKAVAAAVEKQAIALQETRQSGERDEAQSLSARLAERENQIIAANRQLEALTARLLHEQLQASEIFSRHETSVEVLRDDFRQLGQAVSEVANHLSRLKPAPTALSTSAPLTAQAMSTGSQELALDDSFDSELFPVGNGTARPWLPKSRQGFWITQTLRDYLHELHGEAEVGPVEYLMCMVAEFDRKDADILSSPIGIDLISRVTRAANAREPADNPDASIIIPVYNNLIYTLTSIHSILRTPSRFSYEILIGDDLSTDATPAVLSAIGGPVRYVRHARNSGFLGNCNTTADLARGRVIILLNNDTVTLPGWLDELMGTFERHAHVGFVGSKLLNADGTLQEAGGIFWNDGSAWNFGRNQDPRLPEFNYVKDADYCSGASIAIPAEVWFDLGGFDRTFSPAYCEDADIAFRVRAAGLRTLYQPRSALIHHEGRSHGTDTSTGIKAYQLLNQQKLFARWSHVLTREHFPNAECVSVARDRSRNKPHVLFIDHYVPQWDRDAGSRYIYHYLKLFQERGFQVILWPDNLYEDSRYGRELQAAGIEVLYGPAYADRFEQWFAENKLWINYVVCSRPHITDRYVGAIKKLSQVPVLYVGHDLHWKRLQRQYEVTGKTELLNEVRESKTLEDRVCQACDVLIYPSKEECDYVRGAFPRVRGVVEMPLLIYSVDEVASGQRRIAKIAALQSRDLLFVGGFNHPPNVDAMTWLASTVLPLLVEQGWQGVVRVIGSNVPESIQSLAGPHVDVIGPVDDQRLHALYEEAAAAVIPLRFGAGVKGKTIEAFARGVPVVSTPVGLQGVDRPDDVAFCASDAKGFAAALDQVLANRALAATKATQALEFIRQRYSMEAAISSLAPHVPELMQKASLRLADRGHRQG